MERLYTERQQTRYINILLILIFIAFVFCYIDANGITNTIIIDLIPILIFFCIAEIVVLSIWYPNEHMKKVAMEKGEVYTAKIKNIEFRHRTGIHLVRRSYVYVMQIECEIDGETKIWELGNYIDNPETYIPEDYTCKVYVYDGKCYVQDFYRNNKKNQEQDSYSNECMNVIYGKYDNIDIHDILKYSIQQIEYIDDEQFWKAVEERRKYSPVHSKTYMILPAIYFMNIEPYFNLLVEVHMKSKKAYTESDFSLCEKVTQYIQYLGVNDTRSKEQIIEDVSLIVRNAILSGDSRIVIEHIYVVIR